MPRISQERGIREYWEQVRTQYTNVTFEQFSTICKHPFEYFKLCIKNTELPRILIKYLGKIQVTASSVRKMIKSNSILFLKGFRNEVDYIAKEKYFKEYLKLLEDDNDESDKNDTERSEVS